MRRKGWLIVCVILVVMIAMWLLFYKPTVQYADIHEAWTSLGKLKYTCRSDIKDGEYGNGFMVSKDEASWIDAGNLCKVGPMGPEWKNKIWVTPITPDEPPRTYPDDAATRIWGRVFAYGDADFLDEVERGLRRQRASVL